MPPEDISEDILEDKLMHANYKLKHVRSELVLLRNAIAKAETELLGYNLEIDNLTEELRRFRLMYPKLCKKREDQ